MVAPNDICSKNIQAASDCMAAYIVYFASNKVTKNRKENLTDEKKETLSSFFLLLLIKNRKVNDVKQPVSQYQLGTAVQIVMPTDNELIDCTLILKNL